MFRKQFLGLSCICSPVEILPYIEKIDKLDFSVVYLVNFFLLGKKSLTQKFKVQFLRKDG